MKLKKARNEGLHRAGTLTTKLNIIKLTLVNKDDELTKAQNVIIALKHQTGITGKQRKVRKSPGCN